MAQHDGNHIVNIVTKRPKYRLTSLLSPIDG